LNLRVSVQQVGLAFLISGAASLFGAPLSGVIADKWGKRPLLILSGLVLASALAVIPGMAWGPELFGMMGLAGFAMAFRIAPLLALTTELVEPEMRGTFLALRSALASLGIAVSTFVSSYCYQIGGYQAVGLFASGLILVSTLLILVLVREPYHRR
jgi:MFS transporter, DHA1 family, inner membrane transport protein